MRLINRSFRGSAKRISKMATATPESDTPMDVDCVPQAGPVASHEDAMDVDVPADDQQVDSTTGGDPPEKTGQGCAARKEVISVSDAESDILSECVKILQTEFLQLEVFAEASPGHMPRRMGHMESSAWICRVFSGWRKQERC